MEKANKGVCRPEGLRHRWRAAVREAAKYPGALTVTRRFLTRTSSRCQPSSVTPLGEKLTRYRCLNSSRI